MRWIKRKIIVNDNIEFEGEQYGGFTGTTSYVGDNNIWWIDLDEESINKLGYEYKAMCRIKEEDFESICLEEGNFKFID